MATEETRSEASNPSTAPARLQELTSDRELWPLIAANPAAYDGLLTWLDQHGDAEVKAAIAARGGASEPTAVLPPSDPTPAAAPVAAPPVAATTPPPTGLPTPPPGGQFPPPGGGLPAAPGGTPSGGGSKKGLWITLAVVLGLLVASGIGVGVWALTKGDNDSDKDTSSNPTEDSDSDKDKDDEDDEDDDKKGGDASCDDLEDLLDAAADLNSYFPEFDEPEMLEDATDVIEGFEDSGNDDIDDIVEALLAYAEIADDPDAFLSDESFDAWTAEQDLDEYISNEC